MSFFIESDLMHIEEHFLGLQNYKSMLLEQENQAQLVFENCNRGKIHIHIFGLEHPSTISLGKRGSAVEDLIYSEHDLKHHNIEVVISPRGGQATLHSPGQLVIYPIVPIQILKLGAREYVDLLISCTQYCLQKFGVDCFKPENQTGLFTDKGKIAYFGVQISKGITRHGVSINIKNDLNLFRSIRSCGVDSAKHDKLNNYNEDIGLELFFEQWCVQFKDLITQKTLDTNNSIKLRSVGAVGSAFP